VIPDGEFECAAVLMEHTQDVKAVAWHPREDVRTSQPLPGTLLKTIQILASASYDDTIHLYTDDDGADDWTSVCALKGHGSTVWALAFAPRGEHLASVSDDRTLRIWKRGGRGSRDRWAEVAKIDSAHERAIYSVAWTDAPDVEEHEGCRPLGWIATAGADGRINVYTASVSALGCFKDPPPTIQT
jgi:WD40 repeat protein